MQTTPLYRCDHRSRYRPGSDWFRGSKSVSGRKRDPDFEGPRNTGNRACTERRVRQVKSGIFSLYPDGTPYVTMKYAMTMDGKIAAYTGASRWVTGEEARHHVHEQRKKNTAIMVGIGTVLADDPMLNCRNRRGKKSCPHYLRYPFKDAFYLKES